MRKINTKKKPAQKICKEYERRWRDFCVDKNLEDDWLERLNDLRAFILVGICEGHSDNESLSSKRYPQINFRLRKSLLKGIAADWDHLRIEMLQETGKLLHSDNTNMRLELSFRLRAGQGRLVYHEDLKMNVMCFQERRTEGLEEETRAWFEGLIDQIEEIDRVVYGWHMQRLES